MITIELGEREAALLREMLEARVRDVRHEIHHTDDRAFRLLLREKETTLEHLLERLTAPVAAPRPRGRA
jgi:hypothetical protein